MPPPVLALDSLTQQYGSKPVLSVQSVVIDGGATAVLGPNGSGKSTLLRLVATVNEPLSGSIRVAGLDPGDAVERIAIRRRLGYVAQHDGLPDRMRVHEYCDYVCALKEIGPGRLRRRWTNWVLDRVALSDQRGERIGTLSGGMRRRLSVAQALLGGPDLLVLDEPLTSLDAEQRGEVTRLLVELANEATIVVATHHADEMAAVCHRVLVLADGRVAFDGRPTDLANRANGHVWEATAPDQTAACRAIGPNRFRCVAASVPTGATPAEPTVADGYLAVVRFNPAD